MQLKQYLKSIDLNTAAAARDFGVPQRTMSRWVSGERIPRQAYMKKLVVWSDGKITPTDFYDDE